MIMESSTSSQNLNDAGAIKPNEEGPFPDASIVIFDVDTTIGDTTQDEICQIAAWCKGNPFKECMLPNGVITPLCSGINGFTYINGKLFHYGNYVNAVTPNDGLEKFLDFLSKVTGKTRKVLLAANNCKSFHSHIIVRLLKQYNLLDLFKSLVLGFIDTIDVFKSRLQDRHVKFGFEELAREYLDESTIPQQKHAVVNVEILVSLIEVTNCNDAMMKQHVTELEGFILYLDLKKDFENKVKKEQLWKIMEAGITTNMLKDAYRNDPDNGVSNLLRQGVPGKAGTNLMKSTANKITVIISRLCAEDENVGNGTA